jgi:acetylornithine deacetylase/succinyl-diaminopimelate desuccinylase-like protein
MEPGAVNVIPGEITLDVDVRNVILEAREQTIAERRGLRAEMRRMVFDGRRNAVEVWRHELSRRGKRRRQA